MNKKFSISSLIVILIGLLLIFGIFYFGASSMGLFYVIVGIGILIYIIGVIFGVIAFARKEKGLLKYVAVVSVIIVVFFVGYMN